MNVKEFELALKKGLGRCIYAIKENPSKYREVFEKYVCKTMSYDYFFEGTRSTYMYEIISLFNDNEYFYNKIKNEFLKIKYTNHQNIHYLCELLMRFYNDGVLEAIDVVYQKYDDLYNKIYLNKIAKISDVIQAYEILCVQLAQSFDQFFKVSKDIGALLISNSEVSIDYFLWYCDVNKEFITMLTEYEDKYLEIKKFIDCYLIYQEEQINDLKDLKFDEANVDKALFTFSIKLSKMSIEDQKDFAYKYLEMKNVDDKIKYLKCFSYCPFPLLPEFIIEETKSDNKELKEAAYKALYILNNEEVKQFAIDNINTELDYVFPILVRNYDPKTDKELLLNCLKKIKVSSKNMNWHHNYSCCFSLFEKFDLFDLPIEGLKYMYENCLCSFCRGTIVDYLFQNNYLDEEMLEECLKDCNLDIRDIASYLLGNSNDK